MASRAKRHSINTFDYVSWEYYTHFFDLLFKISKIIASALSLFTAHIVKITFFTFSFDDNINPSLIIIEWTEGFESNVQINSDGKKTKYRSLISHLMSTYSNITFINRSMNPLVIHPVFLYLCLMINSLRNPH